MASIAREKAAKHQNTSKRGRWIQSRAGLMVPERGIM
jgi:hypothetical protein